MAKGHRYAVLFVCMGNICRSPAAEGVFRRVVMDAGLGGVIHVESAGTSDFHAGEPADRRMAAAAGRRGYRLHESARGVVSGDFDRYDLIFAMDARNMESLQRLARGPADASRLRMFLDFHPSRSGDDVPDPYYGGPEGFEHVLDLVEETCAPLLQHVRDAMERSGS